MSTATVFYGAGGHAEECLDRWISEGLKPVCFADTDEKKHYKTLGGLEILPLIEAMKRYPDYVLYLTHAYENLRPVTDYLIGQGIPRERIKYADPYEWRKGCFRIGRHVAFLLDSFHICDQVEEYSHISRTGSVESDFEKADEFATNLIDDLRNGRPTACDNCPALIEGIWDKKPKLWRLGVCSEFSKTFCNFKCVYCCAADMLKRGSEKKAESPLELLKKVSKVINTDDVVLGYAAGEITVSPECGETLDFIREKRWYTQLSTNASIYKEKIADLMRAGIIEMNISIDAGTRETFLKVKGADCWDKVVDNIEKYAATGGCLYLKYIILDGINDNEADVDGFIGLCKRFNTDAMLSANYIGWKSMTESMFASGLQLIEKAKENNIKVKLIQDFLPARDYELFEKALQAD